MAFCEEIKRIEVLLVDEDNEFTDRIGKNLEEKNFKCVIANEISVGLLMILEHKFEVVVLDANMLKPLGNDIIEFLAITRRLNKQKLILTTKILPNTDFTLSVLRNGIDAFIAKPLNVDILCEIINRENNTTEKSVNTTFDN